MPIAPSQKTNETQRVEELLRKSFPGASVDAYRQNSAVIRVRMVDPGFEGKSRIQREEEVLPILKALPEDTLSEITLLLLLTPGEVPHSFMNIEFDDPVPSSL